MSQRGKFIWYDLLTPNADAALTFYRSVVGWGIEVMQGPEPYTMWTAGRTSVGGLQAAPGAHPSWLGYAETSDLTASLARATALGGSVTEQPIHVPSIGTYAVLRDPQGAAFALFQEESPNPEPPYQGNGALSWAELNTTDWEGAWKFYSALLGWKPTQSMEMGEEMGTYFMFNGRDDPESKSMGGMSNAARMMSAPPHWMYYATVPDLNAALERVEAGGGKVLNGPMEVPGGDRIAQCTDPQGGYFALHQAA